MARTAKGTIFTQGKKGYYYIRYYVKGKQIEKRLLDDRGNPITRREEAESAKEKIMAVIHARNGVEQLQKVAAALETMELRAARLEAEAKAKAEAEAEAKADKQALKIKQAWKFFTEHQIDPDNPKKRLCPACSPQNLKNYNAYWQKLVQWLYENTDNIPVYVREITTSHVKRFFVALEDTGAAPNTYNKYHAFLKSFFTALMPYSRAKENPMFSVERQQGGRANKRRNLTEEELKAILTQSKGDLHLLLWIGATTGLRLGDAITLQWHNINLKKKIIQTKTRKTQTDVVTPLSDVVISILSGIENKTGYIMPEYAEKYLDKKKQPHLIEGIQQFFCACGIQIHKEGTGAGTGKRAVVEVGYHSLRHSFATICAEMGTNTAQTQQLLGHSREEMTFYYQHSSAKTAGQIGCKVDNYLKNVIDVTNSVEEAEKDELLAAAVSILGAMTVNELKNFIKNSAKKIK